MQLETLFQMIDDRKEEMFELLSRLVRIESQSFGSTGNEKEIAEYIHSLCLELGLESSLYSPMELEGFADHPDYLPGRNLENRYNVTAVWKGEADQNELMLMAHTDTVQFGDPANWEMDPLSGAIRDGRIYGRGAGDDKSGIAVMLFLTKIMKEAGFIPKRNCLLTAYCDEEYGGSHGALAAVLRDPCERVLNLDAAADMVVTCATGGGEMKFKYHCAEPVDSSWRVARALPVAMDVIDEFAARRRSELENNRFYADTVVPQQALRYIGVKAGENGQDLGVGELHFVFYTDKTKEEIYPEFDQMDAVLRERLAPLGMVSDGFYPTTRFFHYVTCEGDHPHVQDYLEVANKVTGRTIEVCGGGLGDHSVIAKYGCPSALSIGCIRNFEQAGGAHQPNEFIECDKMVEFAKIIAAYMLKVLQ